MEVICWEGLLALGWGDSKGRRRESGQDRGIPGKAVLSEYLKEREQVDMGKNIQAQEQPPQRPRGWFLKETLRKVGWAERGSGVNGVREGHV